jgi:hypothetical protein
MCGINFCYVCREKLPVIYSYSHYAEGKPCKVIWDDAVEGIII